MRGNLLLDSFYTTDNSLIIGYGCNDGFWDANFV